MNRLYTLNSSQDQENSPDMVTGMLQVLHLHVYAFLDPGASLFFVTLSDPINQTLFISSCLDTLLNFISKYEEVRFR